jgi:DNA-binding transcriptional ArsR family regulator
MYEFMNITRALSDENRIRALMALRKRELCVCQIIEFLGLAPSTVSKHMSILRQARLIEGRKEGVWMHYSLSSSRRPEVRKAINWVIASLENDEKIIKDEKLLSKIMKCNLEDLCRRKKNKRG